MFTGNYQRGRKRTSLRRPLGIGIGGGTKRDPTEAKDTSI